MCACVRACDGGGVGEFNPSHWPWEQPIAAADGAPGGTAGFGFQSQESDFGTDATRTVLCPRCKRAISASSTSFLIVHRQTIRRTRGCMMYTAGLNPFYASNFSLWSAYCAGGFAVDTMKKPSFCIADILQAGDLENIPGSSALVVHMGHHRSQQGHSGGSPLRPSPVAPEPSVYGPRMSPGSPYHRHGLQLTSVSRTPYNSQQAPPPTSKDLKFGIDRILSMDFDPKGREKSSLRGESGFYQAFPGSFQANRRIDQSLTASFHWYIKRGDLNKVIQLTQYQRRQNLKGLRVMSPESYLAPKSEVRGQKPAAHGSRAIVQTQTRKNERVQFLTLALQQISHPSLARIVSQGCTSQSNHRPASTSPP